MAPNRLQTLLVLAFAASIARWQKLGQQGIARSHFPHGCPEPNLGFTTYSWRTKDARLRHLGTNRFAVDEKSSKKSGAGKTMGHVSEQPSRGIAAIDFFTVPTLTLGVLHCFFIIAHDRRRILYFNVTRDPTSEWVCNQLRAAFPYDSAPKYLISDRDSIFSADVVSTVTCMGIKPIRTAFKSPWQNGIAERWVGNCRRELLDQVIVVNERHLKRLMNEYICYYHEDRTHLGLAKQTPSGRKMETSSSTGCRIISMRRLGGLHHRYDLAA